MSDLEATRSRAQTAAPITAIANGKLRAFAGKGTPFAETDGLVDAFAEVFARIAASSSQPIEPHDSSGDIESVADHNKPAEADDGAAVESESSDSDSATDDEAGELIAVADQEVFVENPAVDSQSESLDKQPDQAIAEDVTIAAIEVNQSETADSDDTKTGQVIAEHGVETEDTNHRKQDRRENPAADLAEPTQRRDANRDRAVNAGKNVEIDDEASQGDEQTLLPTSEQDDAESPRVTRRRYSRNSEASDNATRPVSQTNQTGETRRGSTVSSSLPAAESAVDQSGQASASSSAPTVSRNVEAVIANVQNVASRVDRVNTPSGTQAGTRGSTQAIDATETKRTEPRTADSRPAKKSAADTVSRVKLIQRVSKAFQHLGPEGGVVRLRLAPAEMGAVRVEMRINQRKVQARVVAETEAASAALREHLPDLRARLESFGMQVEKLEIETEANDQQHGSLFDADSQQNEQQWQRQSQPRFKRHAATAKQAVSPDVSQTPIDYVARVTCGVDVRL
jgi:flagellar hook-length control protein FliK